MSIYLFKKTQFFGLTIDGPQILLFRRCVLIIDSDSIKLAGKHRTHEVNIEKWRIDHGFHLLPAAACPAAFFCTVSKISTRIANIFASVGGHMATEMSRVSNIFISAYKYFYLGSTWQLQTLLNSAPRQFRAVYHNADIKEPFFVICIDDGAARLVYLT